MNTLRPSREQTISAAHVIAKHLQPTSLKLETTLRDYIGAEIYVKYEFQNPVRSFKIRGALNLVHELVSSGNVSRVITASTGNHGAGMAYACQQFKMPLTVGVPVGSNYCKVNLIRQFDAKLEFIGRDLDETKELLLKRPLTPGDIFIEDGSSPQIVAGTSTIGCEIVQALPDLEMIFVPVGNGALIGGIGTVLKEFNPAIKVIGVQSDQASCMALSFKAKRPVNTTSCNTFASGIAVRVAIPEAVNLMLEVVDDFLLVTETALKQAMGLFYRLTGHLLEGAGAAALAGALQVRHIIQNKNVCIIASGANVDEALKKEIMEKFV
ncbi:MAG: threonine/serine dehydratase [bacterium]